MLLSDVPVEEISDLYAAEEADDAELDAAVDAPAMSAAEEAGIADVLAIETPTLQLSVAETDAADMAGDVEEEADLDEAMVKEYIKSLQVRSEQQRRGAAAGSMVHSRHCSGQQQQQQQCAAILPVRWRAAQAAGTSADANASGRQQCLWS